MKDCMGVFGRLFGHKFVGRYSTTSSLMGNIESDYMTPEGLEAMKDKTSTYHGDVCTRCGSIDRPI